MAEEQRFQATNGHRMCANNCGFIGSPATQNLCTKCYRDLQIEKPADPTAFASPSTSSVEPITLPEKIERSASTVSHAPPPMRGSEGSNRCSTCRKKVGLMGFRCRCEASFCGVHRYPEKHGCTFDFKALGREEIARANPVVKGQKLQKI